MNMKPRNSSFITIMLTVVLNGLVFSCKNDELTSLLLPGQDKPPSVLISNPLDGSTGVTSQDEIWVMFDQPMDEQKTQSAFRLSSAANGVIYGSFIWDLFTMKFLPKDPLPPAGEYTLVVDKTAESIYGLDLVRDHTVRFFVGTDSVRPVFQTSSPANGETQVLTTSTITLTFSEQMDFSTALSGISVSPSFINTINQSGNQITITPASPLQNGTTYSVTAKTSLKDVSGNNLAEEKTISFTVGSDSIRPSIQSVTSGVNTLTENLLTHGISRGTPILITFNEPMDAINTESSISISPSVNQTKSWLNPSTLQIVADLEAEKSYVLAVNTEATDTAGNQLLTEHIFPFITDAPDSVRPSITQVYQERSGALGVCSDGVSVTGAPISLSQYSILETQYLVDVQPGAGATCVIQLRIEFNKDIDRTSLVLATNFQQVINPSAGDVRIHDIQVSGNVASIQLGPNPIWPSNGGPASQPIFKLNIRGGTDGLKDTNGNTMASNYSLYLYF